MSNLSKITQLDSGRGGSGDQVRLTLQSRHPPRFLSRVPAYTPLRVQTHARLHMHVYLSHPGHIQPLCTQIQLPMYCVDIHPGTVDTQMRGCT